MTIQRVRYGFVIATRKSRWMVEWWWVMSAAALVWIVVLVVWKSK